MTEKEMHNKQLEKMVLDLLLANKIIIQTLFRDKIEMTMTTHVVISAQDKKTTEIRSQFEKYAKTKPDLLKEFQKAEKFGF